MKASKQNIADIFYRISSNKVKFSNFKIEPQKLEDVFLTLINDESTK